MHSDRGHLFSALFSLGIHGLVISFFIPFFLKPCVQMSAPIEVVWQVSQAKSSHPLSPSKAKEEKKVAQSNHSVERCKKTNCTQPPKQTRRRIYTPPVEQASSDSDNQEKGSQKQLAANATSPLGSLKKAYQPLPKYPWISRKRGHEGVVALTIKTNEEGKVIEANLHKSSGHSSLDEAALEAVNSWVLAEGAVKKTLSIVFRLKDLEGKLEEIV